MKNKEKRIKQHFRGVFNFRRKVIVLYAYAYTAKQARVNMCRRISKKDNVPLMSVLTHFTDDNQNYEITIETEIKEKEDVQNDNI